MGTMFVTQMILRRLVAPDDWGIWHWAVDFLFLILGQVRDLGLPAQVVRDPERPYGAFLAVEVVWGAAASALLLLGGPVLVLLAPESGFPAVPLLQALVLFFFLEGLGKVPLTYFEAEIRIEATLAPEIVRNLVYVALSLSLAGAGFGVLSLLIAHVAAAASYTALLWWRARGRMRLAWSGKGMAGLLRSSVPLMLMAMVLLAVDSADYQIMGLRYADEVLGLYGGALTISMLVMRALEWPLRRSLYPTFVAVRDDPRRFFETYRLSTILLMAIHVPVAGLFLLAAPTVLLLWGPQYPPAAPFLQLLALVPLVQPFARCAEDVLLPRHEERLLTVAAVLNLASLVALGVWLTGALGPVGMAWAKLFPLGSLFVVWAIRRVDPRGFGRLCVDLAKVYGIAAVLFGAAWLAAGDGAGMRFALALAAGAASFAVYVGLFGRAFRRFFSAEAAARGD